MIEIIESVTELMTLFVPGYIFWNIYNGIVDKDKEETNIMIIKSIATSYVVLIIIKMFDEIHEPTVSLSEIEVVFWSIIVSSIFAVLVSLIHNTKLWKNILFKLGRLTPNNYIWDDVINPQGTRVRFTTKQSANTYNGIIILRNVANNDCWFVLSDYDIEYNDGTTFDINADENKNAQIYGILLFNTRDIETIEFFYNKPVNEII